MSAIELRLRGVPLAAWERDGLKSALIKAGLAADDVDAPERRFWRFERPDDDMPVGFGGLEIHADDAVLRSVVTLPPLRRRGIGSAIVAALEQEARLHGCRGAYLETRAAAFFSRLG
jgi:N-acetylglutamate synthase-like GNAT family acetyltransferase